jgi:hypothetical protein
MQSLSAEVEALDRKIKAWHKTNETSRRLATIPGIGFLTASAIAATVLDPSFFKSGRKFAAWLGLTPTKFQRRTYIEEGKHLYSPASRRRCDVNVALCAPKDGGWSRLGQRSSQAAPGAVGIPLQWPTRQPGSHGP